MLSILVPTYNRAHLLEETVTHALASMADGDELIIRDNASTDGSQALLKNIQQRDRRLRLELATKNIGPVGNWRECLRLARGEQVKLLFSDDLMFPEAFQRFYKDYLTSGLMVGFTSALIGSKVHDAGAEFLMASGQHMSSSTFIRFMLTHLGKVPVSPSAFVFETILFTQCFDEAMAFLKDKPSAMLTGAGIDLLIVTLAVQYAGGSFYSREPHVFFRQHAGSISTEKSRLVKQLYNLSRTRFAARTYGHSTAIVLMIGYALRDLVEGMRKTVRDLTSV
jgi:glycosyltransferase involved in cell wall biosynthesis